MTLLDHDLARRRRQDLALTERELARLLGVGGAVVRGLEQGRNHETLPLGLLARWAELLGVQLALLLTEPDGEVQPTEPDDAAAIGMLLAEADRLIALDALADALDWSLERVRTAVADLAGRTAGVGLVVHRLNNDVALRPAATRGDEVKELLRVHQARRGLQLTEAKVLYRVMRGTLELNHLGNADRVALGRLQRAGIVDLDVAGLKLTDSAAGSLVGEPQGT